MEKSVSITELAKALIKIQVALKPAIKDKTNPFLKSRYADLSGVWDVCRTLLQENKLGVIQVCGIDAMGVHLETVLVHESGEWISGRYPLKPVRPDDPQALASAVTYARRYTLAAILGIVTEDDDAEGAVGRQLDAKPKSESLIPQKINHPSVVRIDATNDQLCQIEAFRKAGQNIKSKVELHKWNVKKLSELSYDEAACLIKELGSEVAK